MSQSVPQVSCVILNWNNYPDTSECIDSLLQLSYDEFDVIVVDNGSADVSGERLQEEYEDVTVLFTDRNLGFGGGNNRGIQEAMNRGADYIWILNDDVLVPETDSLDVLVEQMESEPSMAALTPLVTEYPKTDEVWFREGYIDWRSGNAGHVNSSRWFVDWRFRSETEPADSLVYHDYLPLCSALIRTEVFKELGLLPEEYFLYNEDVVLCSRAARAGYEIATETDVKIHHKVSASTDSRRSPTHLYYLTRNRLLFKREFEDEFSLSFYGFFLWWLLLNLIDQIVHRNWANMGAIITGLVDGVAGRSGRGRYP